jgi:hypothetical protein
VLAQFQGMGAHLRRDLAGFVCPGMATHDGTFHREVSAAARMAFAIRSLQLANWAFLPPKQIKLGGAGPGEGGASGRGKGAAGNSLYPAGIHPQKYDPVSGGSAVTRLGFCLFALLAFGTLGCGSSRQLQSVSLSPASANAQNFPNGQVSFTATGSFNKPPSPVQLTSKDVGWCVGSTSGMCVGNISVGVTVDQNGLAQCVPGFTGTDTILAGTMSSAMMNPDVGSQLKVFGVARLTCP